MNIEKRYKIATLMASIAGVRDPRFTFAGFSDDQMIKDLVHLEPRPELLGRYMVDLSRAHGADRTKEFEVKLNLAVKVIPNGHTYLETVRRAFAEISGHLASVPHMELAQDIPFDDDLPTITSVMSHIKVERVQRLTPAPAGSIVRLRPPPAPPPHEERG